MCAIIRCNFSQDKTVRWIIYTFVSFDNFLTAVVFGVLDGRIILKMDLNPLNAELNPICHLHALLGAHHIFHVSGLRVKEIGLVGVDCCQCGSEPSGSKKCGEFD